MQTAHAALECGMHLASIPDQPDNIVLCSVPDEPALRAEIVRLQELGISLRVITEPDLGDQITAIATEPLIGKERAPLRRLPLWTNQPAGMAYSHGGTPHVLPGGEAPSPRAILERRAELMSAGVVFGTMQDLSEI